MTGLEPIIQGLTGIFFFGTGVYLLISKRLESANPFEDRIKKVGGRFLIVFGIFIALLMVMLPQPKAWQIGETVLLAAGVIGNLFSGVYNLVYRRRVSMDAGTRKAAKIVGILLLILAAWTGMIFILSVSYHA
ncbi:MAG: hypothetical protein AB1510_00760 [Bacillota bacterium]